MEQMLHWVDMVGLSRLKYLRDCIVAVTGQYKKRYRGQGEFRVTLETDKGLQVQPPPLLFQRFDVDQGLWDWRLAATELRRRSDGWEGEGIIDYFLGEREFWSEWFFSYPPLRNDEARRLAVDRADEEWLEEYGVESDGDDDPGESEGDKEWGDAEDDEDGEGVKGGTDNDIDH